jgi:hypothetical protein
MMFVIREGLLTEQTRGARGRDAEEVAEAVEDWTWLHEMRTA